jgi:tetratricopeptide (TPR) repeat protein
MIKKLLYILFFLSACSIYIFGQNNVAVSNYYKALGYYQQKNNDSALIQLELCNNDIKCIELAGKIYFENKDYTKAINIFKSLLDSEPAEASFYLSLIFADMGFADESMSWLENYFEYKNPRFYSRIISHSEFDNIVKTKEWKEFWKTERFPKNYEKFEEAEYQIRSENYMEAIVLLSSIQSSFLDYYKDYLTALSYFKLGNFAEADKYADASLKVKQKFVEAYTLKYKISIENKKYENACNHANTLLKIDPYEPSHIVKAAEALNLSAKYYEAEKLITEYTGYFSNDENALFLQAHIFINANKKSEAVLILNSLIEKNPSKIDYFILRAGINYEFKSWDLAKKDFAMVLDIDPMQPETLYMIGMCYYKQSSMQKACYYWAKASQMKHREATRMLYNYCDYYINSNN